MADQRSRGGKKSGTDKPQGQSEQHQPAHQNDAKLDDQKESSRPPAGQPGGPKPNAGQTRPQKD
jgi:hypothetical protein